MISQKTRTYVVMMGVLVALVVLAGAYSAAGSTNVKYVSSPPSGNENCSSWDNACGLQNALDTVDSNDQIWVSAGIYIPTKPWGADSRQVSFALADTISIYGGFSGVETELDQRDWLSNRTVLCGDIDGNDTSPTDVIINTNDIIGNNAFHVVTSNNVDGTALLDGFIITAGFDSQIDPSGAGIYNGFGSPTLRNIIFSGNKTSTGGAGAGMEVHGGEPYLENIIFEYNEADYGGGLRIFESAAPTLRNVIFRENVAHVSGGGMLNTDGNPTLIDVLFQDNIAAHYGGGMDSWGGNLLLINVTFDNNSAINYSGGGMGSTMSEIELVNVIFKDNVANDMAGGLLLYKDPLTIIKNVTFAGNTAGNGGGAISRTDGTLIVENTIIWGNSNPWMNGSGPMPVFSDSIVQGGCPPEWGDCLNLDPAFESGSLRLSATSPAIDQGNNDALPSDAYDLDDDGITLELLSLDVDGFWRISNGTVDLGAHERPLFINLPVVLNNVFPGGCEYEPNDSHTTANGYLIPDSTYCGRADEPVVDDYFKLWWSGTGTLHVSVEDYLAGQWAAVYFDDGSDEPEHIDGGYHGSNTTFDIAVSEVEGRGPGTYYIRFFAFEGHPVPTGPYSFSYTID